MESQMITTEQVHELIKKLVPGAIMQYLHPKDGITSSEANHLCEKVKELNKNKMAEIDSASSATETMLYSKQDLVLNESKPIEWETIIDSIGNFFGFNARFRPGVKAKEDGLKLLHSLPLERFLEEPIYEDEGQKPRMKTVYKKEYTDEDAFAAMGMDEATEYVIVEAKCSVEGKQLHAEGKLNQIKNEIFNFLKTIFKALKGEGGLTDVPVTRKPTYTKEGIGKQYLNVFENHREHEKRLNYLKAKKANWLADKNMEAERDFRKAQQEAQVIYSEELRKYNELVDRNNVLRTTWTSQATELRYKVKTIFSSYRLPIPNRLQKIYTEITTG